MYPNKIVTWCDKIIVIGIFIITFAVPLYFDIHLYSTFDLSKVGMMYTLTLILLALWLVKMVTLNDFRSIRTPFDYVILAFLLSNILSTIFSINPVMSLFGCYKRYEGLLAITCYIVIYYLTINFITTKRQVITILSIMTGVGAISGIYALIQHFGQDPLTWEQFNPWRIISFFGNPVFYTVYAMMSFLIGLGIYLYVGKEKKEEVIQQHQKNIPKSKKKKKKKESYNTMLQPTRQPILGNTPLVVMICIALLITYWGFSLGNTRGCYMGLWGGGFVFLWFIGKKILIENKYRLLALGIGVFVLFFYYNIMVKESSVIGRFTGLFAKENIEELPPEVKIRRAKTPIKGIVFKKPWRIFIWKSAIETIKDYPILGTGPDTMGLIFPMYLKKIFPDEAKGPIEFEDRVHQDFLDHALARGIVGVVVYIWGMICFFMLTWKFYRNVTPVGVPIILALVASMIGYIIQNQFSFSVTPISCTLAILAGITVRSGWLFLRHDISSYRIVNNPKLDKILNAIFFSNCSFKPQVVPHAQHKEDISIRKQNKNIQFLWYGLILCGLICLFYLTYRMYVADRYYKLGTIFLGRDTRRAIVEYQRAIDYYPYEVRYRDEMNRAYIERARKAKSEEERHFWAKKAIEGAKELLRRTPGYANGYFTLGIANYLLAQDKYDKNIYEAIKYYKKAIKHNPFSADTYNNLGVIYNSQNRLDDAIRVFKEAYRMNPKHVASLDNLARIYITKNQLEKALEILEELQNTDPTYQSARIQNMIGYLYWKLGKIDKVEEQCKLALAEDPNDVSARENLGIIYFKKGMYKKAAIQFRKVLELEPDNIKARRMLQAIAEKGDE